MEHIDRTPGTQLSESEAAAEARRIIENLYRPEPTPAPIPTSYRDTSPNTPSAAAPVAQEGRPPMSQKAVDRSAYMLSGSVLTVAVGGAATGVLWASGAADPTVIALVCAAPPALVLAISRVVRRLREAVEAAPPEIHQHYTGPVVQNTTNVDQTTKGLWATTRNQVER